MIEFKKSGFITKKRFLFLVIASISLMTNCTNKTKSDIKNSSALKVSETAYDSKTDLYNYIGIYELKAINHLGNNYKDIPSRGRLKVTKIGMKLITDLDSLQSFEANHDKTNLLDISKGKFVFESKDNKLTMLNFYKEKNIVAFSNGTLKNSFISIFVYVKEKQTKHTDSIIQFFNIPIK